MDTINTPKTVDYDDALNLEMNPQDLEEVVGGLPLKEAKSWIECIATDLADNDTAPDQYRLSLDSLKRLFQLRRLLCTQIERLQTGLEAPQDDSDIEAMSLSAVIAEIQAAVSYDVSIQNLPFNLSHFKNQYYLGSDKQRADRRLPKLREKWASEVAATNPQLADQIRTATEIKILQLIDPNYQKPIKDTGLFTPQNTPTPTVQPDPPQIPLVHKESPSLDPKNSEVYQGLHRREKQIVDFALTLTEGEEFVSKDVAHLADILPEAWNRYFKLLLKKGIITRRKGQRKRYHYKLVSSTLA